MKLKQKINQRFKNSADWILNDPKSLTILLLMGTIIGSLFFTTFALMFGINKMWFLSIFFGVMAYASGRQGIKMIKLVKKFGLTKALSGITANEFVWRKNGGVKSGNSGYENNESSNNTDEEGDGKIGKEIFNLYRQPKRLSKDGSNKLSDVKSNRNKSRN